MKTSERFKEYIWLIDLLKTYGGITLEEINEEWVQTEMSGGVEMARSTFNRHKDAIEDMFGVYIECDRSNGYKYYIGNERVLEEDTIQTWMLSTLSIGNKIHENKSLYGRVLLEGAPENDCLLDDLMEGMRKSVKVDIGYRKYEIETTPHVVIEPYCLKMFNRHWYVLGRLNREYKGRTESSFSLFALDKIVSVRLTDDKFSLPEDFDANAYFANYFGAIVYDGTKPEAVVVRVYGNEAYELLNRPLHHSQKCLNETDNYADFEYTLCPTTDFRDYIIGRGTRMKVISPKWLADEIRYKHMEAAKAYMEE